MTHKYVAAFEAVQNHICDTHGIRSGDCKTAHRATNAFAAASAGGMVGAAMGGRNGAAWGIAAGLLLGLASPEAAQSLRALDLNKRLHFLL